MMDVATLQRRAKRRLRAIERRRRDPRYRQVLGRFVADGLVVSNEAVEPYTKPLAVEDVIWSGEIEPRFLELLPALLVKCPSMFVAGPLPEELLAAVRKLRRNLVPESFAGVDGHKLYEWLPRVGRKNRLPSRSKSFRLNPEDLRLLERLASDLETSETDVVRRGLRALLAAI